MKNYYINLDSANARRIAIEKNLQKSNLQFTRYPAVEGKSIIDKESSLNNSQLGCYYSHLQIINYSQNLNEDLLIIEDDEDFNENINILPNIVKEIDRSDWDIIYLDATIVEISDYLFISKSLLIEKNQNIFRRSKLIDVNPNSTIFGTHAYIINKNSLSKITKLLFDGLKFNKPIDNIYSHAIKNRTISAKLLAPLLFFPSINANQSQISTEEHPLMNDWILYRNLISSKNFFSFDNGNYFDLDSFNKSLEKILINRINYSVLGEFLP